MATETTRQAARPARRTIVKGAAWAVPAVAVASAAPAYAASPGCTETGLCFSSAGIHKCCDAGDKYYWADITFTNTSNVNTTVNFTFDLVTSANGTLNFSGGGPVAANSSATFRVTSDLAGNCSQGTYAAFTISFMDPDGNTGEAVVPGGSTGGSECPPPELTARRAVEAPAVEEPAETEVDEPANGAPVEEPAVEEPTSDAPAEETTDVATTEDEDSTVSTDTSEATATPENN